MAYWKATRARLRAHHVATGLISAASLALGSIAVAQVSNTFLADVIVTRDDAGARIRLNFNCSVHYVAQNEPDAGSDLVLHFDARDTCGAGTLGAETRRVRDGELASLVEVEYDAEGASGPELSLHFSREVQFRIEPQTTFRELVVAVSSATPPPRAAAAAAPPAPAPLPNAAPGLEPPTPAARAPSAAVPGRYVINLRSSVKPFAAADLETLKSYSGYTAYQIETQIQSRTWYRLRLGFFEDEKSARATSDALRADYGSLWIAIVENAEVQAALADPLLESRDTAVADAASPAPPAVVPLVQAPASATPVGGALAPAAAALALTPEKRAELLEQGRRALAEGELSQAVQIFTKILQKTDDEYAETAQELLGVARERNGQTAHARAGYEQYLARYPDGEGAARVRQRLAAITASAGNLRAAAASRPAAGGKQPGPWNVDTTLWQYYRRQEAQVNDDPALLSQSALLSNVDLSVRRAGTAVNLQSRLALGYWYDFMGADGNGNEKSISHAYVEADANSGAWRARVGRQSRGSAGVLGRFDGVHVAYVPRERMTLNFVSGYPVYSTHDGFDQTRMFEAVSVDFADVAKAWDLSAFYNQQTADGILDRRAIGTEARYFDDHRSLYALADYDLSFSTLNNVYVVGNWRTRGRLTMNATVNRAHSPYLTTSNALMGQPLTSIGELLALDTEDEIRQLALDRTATSTTYSVGLSRPLWQKLQIDVDATSTTYSATAASGGVEGFPASDYNYYSVSLMGQSLIKEGDMGILSLRFGDTTSYQVTSLGLDGRYPVRGLRINPRIRVDRRTHLSDGSAEWVYTPSLRMQFQWRRRYYFEFEGGAYLSNRKLDETTNDFRTTYFNLGYRYVF